MVFITLFEYFLYFSSRSKLLSTIFCAEAAGNVNELLVKD